VPTIKQIAQDWIKEHREIPGYNLPLRADYDALWERQWSTDHTPYTLETTIISMSWCYSIRDPDALLLYASIVKDNIPISFLGKGREADRKFIFGDWYYKNLDEFFLCQSMTLKRMVLAFKYLEKNDLIEFELYKREKTPTREVALKAKVRLNTERYKVITHQYSRYNWRNEAQKLTRAGYVYLLAGGDYYKIGRSVNVDIRIAQIEPKLPFEIKLVHHAKVKDMYETEAFLHEKFADKRVRGEWFRLTQDDVGWIKDWDGDTGEVDEIILAASRAESLAETQLDPETFFESD